MKGLFHGLAALLLLTAGAAANPAQVVVKQPLGHPAKLPLQLSDKQMDTVSAGFLEIDRSNTSFTILSLFFTPSLLDSTPNTIGCSSCFLLINSPKFSLGSVFGQPVTTPTAPP
jgi:hypothetical protein